MRLREFLASLPSLTNPSAGTVHKVREIDWQPEQAHGP